jgi:hypothetical protein
MGLIEEFTQNRGIDVLIFPDLVDKGTTPCRSTYRDTHGEWVREEDALYFDMI